MLARLGNARGAEAMRPEDALNVEHLHRLARRRTPRLVFDYFEGGAEDERGLARNEAAFRGERLLPRYLVDVSQVDLSTTLFRRTYAAPFGIAPFGVAGLIRHGAERMLAEAAAAAHIPYALPSLGYGKLEDIAPLSNEYVWYQLYGSKERRITEDQIRRAADAGMPVLVFTVDVPGRSNRERDIRNRFGQKPIPLWAMADALRHPAWLWEWYRNGGMPAFANIAPYCPDGASADAVLAFAQQQFPVSDHTWRDIERFRRIWPGAFVLKGILHPDDARRAIEVGVEGVIVSNHGGRQLDRAPSPLEVLPAIRAAVGERLALLLDSGVRRGSDVVIARALGADFVLAGRAFAYGVGAFGQAGARRAFEILQREVEITLRQIGCPRADQLGPQFVLRAGEAPTPSLQTSLPR
jgi:L-lactate dehydrogenase (cytochrome)/(S)-mandelate dehydrogenase